MDLLKNTLFINLEERPDRLEHVTVELSKLHIVGEPFKAIKTQNGAIGCSLSHIKCLEIAKEKEYEQVFICEDDITFLNPPELLENLEKFHQKYQDNWDVVLIGGNNCPPYEKTDDFCIRVSNCQTTTGYIVKKHYYNTLIVNFKEGLKHFLREPHNSREYALDIFWKKLQTTCRWYMIIPLSVTQYTNYSNIENRETNYTPLMLDLDKEWLFRKQPPPQYAPPKFHNMTYFTGNN